MSPDSLQDDSGLREWFRLQWKIVAAAGGIIVAALIAYCNTFSVPLIFDDVQSVLLNPSIRHLGSIENILLPTNQDPGPTRGRPLSNLSMAVNYAMNGPAVGSYHVVNLLIHILAGLVLMGVVRRTFLQPVLRDRFGPVALPLSWIIAMLWTVHPLQTEAVTYISQRCESLMGLFYLLTLYAFIRAMEAEKHPFWLAGSVVACFLGIISKEVAVSAPLIILLYDRTFVSGSFKKALTEKKEYYAALACMWPFLAWLMTHSRTAGTPAGITPEAYLLSEAYALGHYVGLAFWPHPLIFDYGKVTIKNFSEVMLQAFILLVLGGAILYAMRRAPTATCRWPALGFLGCWFFLILSPTSSFVPVRDPVVEYRMYLSLAAIIVMVVSCVYAWMGRRGMVPFLILIPVFITLGVMRNEDYRSAEVLWRDTLEKRPSNIRSQENLALVLMAEGKPDEALQHFQKGVEIDPQDSMAHSNFGGALLHVGRTEEATLEDQEALKLDPKNSAAYTNQGIMLVRAGKKEEALEQFQNAVENNPQDAQAHVSLGFILTEMGRNDEAIQQFEEALQISPEYIEAHAHLGALYGKMNKLAEAEEQFQAIINIDPQNVMAYYNSGQALLQMRRIPEAKEQFEQALRIRPGYRPAQNSLNAIQQLEGIR